MKKTFLRVQIQSAGIKTLILGLYVPNEDKETFYKHLMDKLVDLSFDKWSLLGDWKKGIFPFMNGSTEKDTKAT